MKPDVPQQMSVEERRALLKPGEVASGFVPGVNGGALSIIGRVPYDGSTRQQRRAMAREK